MKTIKKQLITLVIFSILVSIGAIIHGLFFDLDVDEIKRLTIEGIVITFLVVFPGILILEKIFDINNQKELVRVNKRINNLESKLKRRVK